MPAEDVPGFGDKDDAGLEADQGHGGLEVLGGNVVEFRFFLLCFTCLHLGMLVIRNTYVCDRE